MPRLDEDQRAAILADGATFDGEYVDSESLSEAIGTEHAMRALRIVARLDGIKDLRALLVRVRHQTKRGEAPGRERWEALARALEEVGR